MSQSKGQKPSSPQGKPPTRPSSDPRLISKGPRRMTYRSHQEGIGYVKYQERFRLQVKSMELCPFCNGHGKRWLFFTCKECGGTGKNRISYPKSNKRTETPYPEFAAILISCGTKKTQVIREIQSITGQFYFTDAKELEEGRPILIRAGLTKKEAEEIKARLETVGAHVEIKNKQNKREN